MSAIWTDETQAAISQARVDDDKDAQWLATYGAAHVRYTRWLYWLMACCVAAYVLAGQMGYAAETAARAGTDTVSRQQMAIQSRTLGELRLGERACTYLGWVVSKEGHVWLDLGAVAELACAPNINHTLLLRTKTGWVATVVAPVPVNDWDESYRGKGWTRAERVEVVR